METVKGDSPFVVTDHDSFPSKGVNYKVYMNFVYKHPKENAYYGNELSAYKCTITGTRNHLPEVSRKNGGENLFGKPSGRGLAHWNDPNKAVGYRRLCNGAVVLDTETKSTQSVGCQFV